MVCYARRGITIAGVACGAILLFGSGAGRFLAVSALLVSLGIVLGSALLAAAVVFTALRLVRHRRALAGGCVGCRYRCQHAMTEAAQPHWLIRSVDRGAGRQAGPRAATPALVYVPMPRVPVPDGEGPRWPDRVGDTTAVMIKARG